MMKLLGEYLKTKKKSFIYFIVYIIVFLGVFALYKVPFDAVLYGCIICAFLGVILAVYDFSKFVSKHRFLIRAIQTVTDSLDELPVDGTLIENDFIQLVEVISKDTAKIKYGFDNKYKEMLDYFTMWAHQIKTPIAAMRLLIQNTYSIIENIDTTDSGITTDSDIADLDMGNESEVISSIREIEAELFRIEQYVEMVLYYLRSGSDTTDYVIRRYELDKLIRCSIRKYATLFIRKKLKLTYEGTDAFVLTDEKWLGFVIEQILANSIKYTEKGGITISVVSENDRKYISIEDTGMGIAKEDLPRVFEKGYTGYNGREDKKSTGIGLYLCNKIVKKLGHTIEIYSEVGKGTKVVIGINDAKVVLND